MSYLSLEAHYSLPSGSGYECQYALLRCAGLRNPMWERALTYQELTPERWHDYEDGIVRNQIIPHGYSFLSVEGRNHFSCRAADKPATNFFGRRHAGNGYIGSGADEFRMTLKPFAGPQAVLAYLSRYTHRVATSGRRLVVINASGSNFTGTVSSQRASYPSALPCASQALSLGERQAPSSSLRMASACRLAGPADYAFIEVSPVLTRSTASFRHTRPCQSGLSPPFSNSPSASAI